MHKWSWKLQTLTKPQLRKTLITLRNSISSAQRDSAALSALSMFLNHPLFINHQNIACYFATNNEFNCTPFIEAIWAAKKNCFLPVLSKTKTLHFVSYQKEDVLHLNPYQILEPQHTKMIPYDELDLVLLPLVGFDLQGGRLGMGGGYYDRTFSFLKENRNKPYLVGLAYECQCVSWIPKETHDVQLTAILTEKRWYHFAK